MTGADRRRFPVLLAVIAALLVFIAVDAVSSPVQAQTPAAELTGLSLSSGTLRPAFDPAVTEYRAAVKHIVMQITVTGTAAGGVTVTYNDATGVALADADDSTGGHQVDLGLGETVFQVAAASGSDTETYTVTMERDASAFLGWTPTKDIDLDGENTDAVGMWSDGTTLWVADSADAKLYAYTLATRTRNSGEDIDDLDADNANPTGIWSDGTTLWVADDTDDKLYAYTLSTETRDDTRDITLDADNDNPSALWGNTTHIYVAENERNDDTIYAYTIATGAAGGDRDPTKDVDGGRWNGETTAIWSDGTTLWGSEADASVVMAYSLETGIWAEKQFYLPSNQFAAAGTAAMWSDGTTAWFKEDIADGKLYSYNLPSVAGTTTLSALSITYGSSGTEAALRPAFALNEHSYEAAVPSSASRITIAAAANDSSSTLQLLDSRGLLADADTAAGHQVGVTVGFASIFLKVTSSSGDALTYIVRIGRDSALIHGRTPTKDIDGLFAGEDVKPGGIWSDGTTFWVGSNRRALIYAYTLATGARDPDKDIRPNTDIDDVLVVDITSLWGNATTLWVGGPGNKIRAYKLDLNADGTAGDDFGDRDSDKDIPIGTDNYSASGIWSDGATMWVADTFGNKVYAYALSDGARQTNKDFDLDLVRPSIGGIWSDGDTMWATDNSIGGQALRAYKLDLNTDGSPGDEFGDPDPGKDIPVGVRSKGVWSDGVTIWVTTTNPKKAYSFKMAPNEESATTLTGLAVTYDSGTDAAFRPAFSWDQYDYRAAVPNSAGQVTVTPTKHTAASSVSYLYVNGADIADADGGAEGQQVSTRVGETPFHVQVTSGAVSLTYVLTVERDSAEGWGWTPTQDYNYLTAGNSDIRGMWSNADTLYVSHLLDTKIYAYDLEDGSRDSDKDITLPTREGSPEVLNKNSRGLWSDGTTLWAVDQVDEILYAYTLSTGGPDTDKDIALSFPTNNGPIDVWSDGTTIWVSDTYGAILYAYKLDLNDDGTPGADFGARDQDKDITLVSANNAPMGIWSDGDTMWVADWFGQRAYAYALDGGARQADREFDLGAGPWALWSDGVSMRAMTTAGKKIYSYRMPLSADATLKSLSLSDVPLGDMMPSDITLSPEFSAETTSYTASVESSVESTTVTAVTAHPHATAVIKVNDVEDEDGTVDLVAGYNVITVVVTAQDGTTTRTYTVTVLRAQPEDTCTSDSETITSLLSRLDVKAVDGASNQIAGYKASPSQGSLNPAGFNYPAGFGRWYTVEALAVEQGQSANSAPTSVAISVRGAVTSVESSGNDRAHVLPAGADIDLRLDTDEYTRTYSLKSATRTVTKCFDVDGNELPRDCREGETATETYKWTSNLPPRLADGDKVIARLRYSAPRPGMPGRPLVTAPEGKSGALVVNWGACENDPKVRGYEVLLSPAPDGPGVNGAIRVTGGSTTRLPVLLLEPDTVYDVRVRARSGLASGPWSDTVRATTNPLQGTNSPVVTLDLNDVTKVKVGDRLYKRLRVTGMNNLHADAFPEWFEGYYQGNFVEFRVLDSMSDSYEYEDLTHGYGEGAFYAGALTIGEDGEVYHNFGYEVIATGPVDGDGAPEYGPLYLWLERTTGVVRIGSTTANSRETALCVEIADSSNTVPTGASAPPRAGRRATRCSGSRPASMTSPGPTTVRASSISGWPSSRTWASAPPRCVRTRSRRPGARSRRCSGWTTAATCSRSRWRRTPTRT